MRGALHVLATLVLVPYVVLALGFALLGNAIATGSIGGFFLRLLDFALVLVPWGALGLAAALTAIAALGLVARTRRLGGAIVAVLGMACLATIAFVPSASPDAGALAFLVPCFAASACGAWLYLRPAALTAASPRVNSEYASSGSSSRSSCIRPITK